LTNGCQCGIIYSRNRKRRVNRGAQESKSPDCYTIVTNGVGAAKEKQMKTKFNAAFKYLFALVCLLALTLPAAAQSDVTDITDAATSVFSAVATICVTIGVFMIGYRLARKIR